MEGRIPYRVEYAKTNRAGCKGSAICKRDQVKIAKSELRFGTWVETEKISGFQWRHWGCVTSKVLKNVNDKTEGDYDLLDGLEDLFEEDQKKVKRGRQMQPTISASAKEAALSQGSVDEADLSPQVLEEMKDKEAKDEAKQAEKEAKKVQKEQEKEEKKAQKDEEKKAEKAEVDAAKALKAKKRKRDTPDTETEEEDIAPKGKRKVKQEDDATSVPKGKAKKNGETAKAKGKSVKEEETDSPSGKNIKKEENGTNDPKQAKKVKTAKASDLDGGTDAEPRKGPRKAKKVEKVYTAPTRRSARTKR